MRQNEQNVAVAFKLSASLFENQISIFRETMTLQGASKTCQE